MGLDDALGAGALESAGLGLALSHGPVPTRRAAGPASAPDQCGLGPANDPTGPPLAAGTTAGAGGRWGLCRGRPGAGVCEAPGGHGLAPALGGRAVSPPRTTAPGQTWSQAPEGDAS